MINFHYVKTENRVHHYRARVNGRKVKAAHNETNDRITVCLCGQSQARDGDLVEKLGVYFKEHYTP